MNSIQYLTDYIRKSSVDLNENLLETDQHISAAIKSSLSLPAAPKNGDKMKCILDLTINQEDKTAPFIYIQLCVVFQIEQFDTLDELKQVAQDVTLRQSVGILQDKLARLTELHTGKALELPLSDPF